MKKKKGRILCIRYGVNPNSSSIGSDLSLLLMSAAAVTIMVNVIDATVRLWLGRRKKGHPVES